MICPRCSSEIIFHNPQNYYREKCKACYIGERNVRLITKDYCVVYFTDDSIHWFYWRTVGYENPFIASIDDVHYAQSIQGVTFGKIAVAKNSTDAQAKKIINSPDFERRLLASKLK